MKKRINRVNLVTCLVFFGILLAMPIITAILPKKTFSEIENTYLQTMPKISAKAIYDRSYMNKLETYISDHFAGRTCWIKVKTNLENALGKYEQNGVYILKNRLVEKIPEPDYESIDKTIAAVNTFAEVNDVPVFFMLVPTSAEIYADEIPKNAPNISQKELIGYVYGNLKHVNTIDVYGTMTSNREKYIYYRTDHHWTTKGAYYAYAAAGNKMGYIAEPEGAYDVEHAASGFIGTFYSKVLYDGIEPDNMDYYHLVNGSNVNEVIITSEYGKEPVSYDSMYFRDYLGVKDKYASFLGTNQPIVTVKTDSDGGKLLIFKDSYAHCYTPFLTENYSEITLLDMRYIKMSYREIVNVEDYDQVLFLYNASSFASDTGLIQLAYN